MNHAWECSHCKGTFTQTGTAYAGRPVCTPCYHKLTQKAAAPISITRYSPVLVNPDYTTPYASTETSPDGSFVLYTDYEKLRKTLENLKHAVINILLPNARNVSLDVVQEAEWAEAIKGVDAMLGVVTPTPQVHPNNGGCWFCYQANDKMLFSTEFDCFFHRDCLMKEPDTNPEAEIMRREMGIGR